MNNNRKAFIQEQLALGASLSDIGRDLGVSRQRIYQLMTRHGIPTPERRKKNFWKAQPIELKWLWRAFISKNLPIEGPLWDRLSEALPIHCPMLGIPLDYTREISRSDNSPSIDRIDSNLGYTPDNVHVISWRANRIKNDSTPDELTAIADYMRKLRPYSIS